MTPYKDWADLGRYNLFLRVDKSTDQTGKEEVWEEYELRTEQDKTGREILGLDIGNFAVLQRPE